MSHAAHRTVVTLVFSVACGPTKMGAHGPERMSGWSYDQFLREPELEYFPCSSTRTTNPATRACLTAIGDIIDRRPLMRTGGKDSELSRRRPRNHIETVFETGPTTATDGALIVDQRALTDDPALLLWRVAPASGRLMFVRIDADSQATSTTLSTG